MSEWPRPPTRCQHPRSHCVARWRARHRIPSAPKGLPKTKQRQRLRKKTLACALTRRQKCASRKKSLSPRSRAFVSSFQLVDLPLAKPICGYDRTSERLFLESDPIGLEGGLNTYGFVFANPLKYSDRDGLRVEICCRLLDSFAVGAVGRQRHCYFLVDGIPYGLYPEDSPSGVLGVPRTGDLRDKGGKCASCTPKDCHDPTQCAKDAHATYPIGAYSTMGPNSNTYVGDIARFCCKNGVPPGLGSAPGTGDRPPRT